MAQSPSRSFSRPYGTLSMPHTDPSTEVLGYSQTAPTGRHNSQGDRACCKRLKTYVMLWGVMLWGVVRFGVGIRSMIRACVFFVASTAMAVNPVFIARTWR